TRARKGELPQPTLFLILELSKVASLSADGEKIVEDDRDPFDAITVEECGHPVAMMRKAQLVQDFREKELVMRRRDRKLWLAKEVADELCRIVSPRIFKIQEDATIRSLQRVVESEVGWRSDDLFIIDRGFSIKSEGAVFFGNVVSDAFPGGTQGLFHEGRRLARLRRLRVDRLEAPNTPIDRGDVFPDREASLRGDAKTLRRSGRRHLSDELRGGR